MATYRAVVSEPLFLWVSDLRYRPGTRSTRLGAARAARAAPAPATETMPANELIRGHEVTESRTDGRTDSRPEGRRTDPDRTYGQTRPIQHQEAIGKSEK